MAQVDRYTSIEIDYHIMDVLRRNPRATLKEIQREVDMNQNTIHFRMQRIRKHFELRGEFYKKDPCSDSRKSRKLPYKRQKENSTTD